MLLVLCTELNFHSHLYSTCSHAATEISTNLLHPNEIKSKSTYVDFFFLFWLVVLGFLLFLLWLCLINLLITDVESGDFHDFSRFKIALLTERYCGQHLVKKEAF